MPWRKSIGSVFLVVIAASNVACRQETESAFPDSGFRNDDLDNDEKNPFQAEDDDAKLSQEGMPRLGPFNTTLDTDPVTLRLAWTILLEDESSWENADIEFKLFSNSTKINWVAFGFTKDKKFNKADWFVAWKSHKKGVVHTRDCNSMKGVLHYDRQQDYDVVSSRRPHSFTLTVRRALDTGDIFDVMLEKTKPTTLVWAYGMASKFSNIKREIKSSWKSKEILLFGERDGKVDAVAESPKNSVEGMPNEEETGNDREKDKNVKSSPPGKNHVTGPQQQQHPKDLERNRTNTIPFQNSSISYFTNPCTVVIKYKRSWGDYLKLKERSIYYAILGSAAIMTGMIVVLLACCCRKDPADPRKSKVSFYKVDDYEDEQVEFLKERA